MKQLPGEKLKTFKNLLTDKKSLKYIILILIVAVLIFYIVYTGTDYGIKAVKRNEAFDGLPVYYTEAVIEKYDFVSRDMTSEEISKLTGTDSTSLYGHFDKKAHTLKGLEGYIGEARLIAVTDGCEIQNTAQGKDRNTLIGGVMTTIGHTETAVNGPDAGKLAMFLSFRLGDNDYYMELTGSSEDAKEIKSELINLAKELISNGKQDFSSYLFEPEEK